MQSEMPPPVARCGLIPAPFGDSREPAIAVHEAPVVVDRDRELDAAIADYLASTRAFGAAPPDALAALDEAAS